MIWWGIYSISVLKRVGSCSAMSVLFYFRGLVYRTGFTVQLYVAVNSVWGLLAVSILVPSYEL